MLKSKKTIIIVLSVVLLLLIFLIPVYKKENITDGKAISFTSLTYKVISWNAFEQSNKPYNKTEFYIFPKNFNSIKKLWNAKDTKLLKNGYGATATYTTVNNKTDEYIIVSSINKSEKQNITIDKESFVAVANGVTFDEIKYGTKLTIINVNLFCDTYQDEVVKIFEISPTTVETTITTETITNNQSGEITNNQSTSSEPQYNQSENTSSIKSNTVEQPKKEDNTNQESTSSQSVDLNIDLPMYEPKGFWFQNVHKYPEHYDQKSNLLMPYIVVEPENYDPEKTYPVILYFHGAGDGYPKKEDDEYEYQLRFNQRQAFQFVDGYIYCYEWLDQAIIIMPQLNNGNWWNFYPEEDGPLDAAMRIFDKVTSEFSCDSSRYYVMGPSMGGYATMEVAAKYNDIFAAAMPSCAAWTCTQEDAERLKDMPILFLHGTSDNLVSYLRSQQNYELIKSTGSTIVSVKLYDGADHDLWRYSLKDDEPFEWLFSKYKQ